MYIHSFIYPFIHIFKIFKIYIYISHMLYISLYIQDFDSYEPDITTPEPCQLGGHRHSL